MLRKICEREEGTVAHGKKTKTSAVGFKLICCVMLIVLPVFILLVMLVRQDVLELSKEKLALRSQSGKKSAWSSFQKGP